MATLLALYNAIWTQGEYPKPWKEAIALLLLKTRIDPLKTENYCPVLSSNLLQGQERPVCTCIGALTVKHIIEDSSTLAELRQRHRVKGDLKEDLGKNS